MADDLFHHLDRLARPLAEAVLRALAGAPTGSRWAAGWEFFRRATGTADPRDFAGAVAQGVVGLHYGVMADEAGALSPAGVDWLVRQADPAVRCVLDLGPWPWAGLAAGAAVADARAAVRDFLDPTRIRRLEQACRRPGSDDPTIYFLEQLLRRCDAGARRRQGVFYTPQELVSFTVRGVDDCLKDEFQLPGGLADSAGDGEPFVRILDPAMGTGVFLAEVVRQIHRHVSSDMDRAGSGPGPSPSPADWEDYVTRRLLPRLVGQEVMLPALVLGHLSLARTLADTGYAFREPGRLRLYLANTLRQPALEPGSPQSNATRGDERFSVVIGNPPFSGVSDNREPWLNALLRGRAPDGRPVADYFQVDGQPLRERKHWLQDDYVKFMRLAQWRIESAGAGIVALVTNHGFLDNVTFRGMRRQLLTTFPRMTFIDLHGNQRGGERAPDGGHDESVFAIAQGVAVSLLRRPRETDVEPEVRYAQLWGRRSDKLHALRRHTAGTLASVQLQPRPPAYHFVPKRDRFQTHYERAFRLPDLMPVHSTAAVTARDALVVAFSDEELRERMEVLADARVPDEVVRSRFFQASRSPKYTRGDTRGWRLSAARRRIQDEPHWERYIRDCLYRPFDRRKVFWASWMIDWPRPAVMRHLESGANLALIARRQTPPAQPCLYFWVSNTVVVDGLIRSDNRGSESVFPLVVYPDGREEGVHSCQSERVAAGTPNFEPSFLAECAARYATRPTGPDTADGNHQDTAIGLFHYIYALFHAPSYRLRFADGLHTDYPRVLLPRRPELLRALARAGARLVRYHLQWDGDRNRDAERPSQAGIADNRAPTQSVRIDAGYPKYVGERVWWNASTSIGPVAPDVWAFRVGTYQVCRKWIRDRRDRPVTPGLLREYRDILAAIQATIGTARRIDRQIDRHGGWEHAFD